MNMNEFVSLLTNAAVHAAKGSVECGDGVACDVELHPRGFCISTRHSASHRLSSHFVSFESVFTGGYPILETAINKSLKRMRTAVYKQPDHAA